MTVLVTGAGGFIGSRLVELLLANGHQVRALARYNGKGSPAEEYAGRVLSEREILLAMIEAGTPWKPVEAN